MVSATTRRPMVRRKMSTQRRNQKKKKQRSSQRPQTRHNSNKNTRRVNTARRVVAKSRQGTRSRTSNNNRYLRKHVSSRSAPRHVSARRQGSHVTHAKRKPSAHKAHSSSVTEQSPPIAVPCVETEEVATIAKLPLCEDSDSSTTAAAVTSTVQPLSTVTVKRACVRHLPDGEQVVLYTLSNGSRGVYFVADQSCVQQMRWHSTAHEDGKDVICSSCLLVMYVDSDGHAFVLTVDQPLTYGSERYVLVHEDKTVDAATEQSHSALQAYLVPATLAHKFAVLLNMHDWYECETNDEKECVTCTGNTTYHSQRWQPPLMHEEGSISSKGREVVDYGMGVYSVYCDDIEDCGCEETPTSSLQAASQWRIPYVAEVQCRVKDGQTMCDGFVLANILQPYSNTYTP